jgi:hypothetical protein
MIIPTAVAALVGSTMLYYTFHQSLPIEITYNGEFKPIGKESNC